MALAWWFLLVSQVGCPFGFVSCWLWILVFGFFVVVSLWLRFVLGWFVCGAGFGVVVCFLQSLLVFCVCVLGGFLVFGCGLEALCTICVFQLFGFLVELSRCYAFVAVDPMAWLSFAFVA